MRLVKLKRSGRLSEIYINPEFVAGVAALDANKTRIIMAIGLAEGAQVYTVTHPLADVLGMLGAVVAG